MLDGADHDEESKTQIGLAAEAVLRAQAEGAVPKAEWLALVETVRAQAAALIGAASFRENG